MKFYATRRKLQNLVPTMSYMIPFIIRAKMSTVELKMIIFMAKMALHCHGISLEPARGEDHQNAGGRKLLRQS